VPEVIEKFSETCEFDELEQPERFYPVVVEVTRTYVVWQSGEDYADAVRIAKNDPELYEAFDKNTAQGGGWEVRDKPYPWEYEPDYPEQVGPRSRCPECLSVSPYIGYQTHERTCPEYQHRAHVITHVGGPNAGKSRGECNCQTLDTTLETFPWRPTREEALADVDRHAVGKKIEVRRG
jgi:hypothetical protein